MKHSKTGWNLAFENKPTDSAGDPGTVNGSGLSMTSPNLGASPKPATIRRTSFIYFGKKCQLLLIGKFDILGVVKQSFRSIIHITIMFDVSDGWEIQPHPSRYFIPSKQ